VNKDDKKMFLSIIQRLSVLMSVCLSKLWATLPDSNVCMYVCMLGCCPH